MRPAITGGESKRVLKVHTVRDKQTFRPPDSGFLQEQAAIPTTVESIYRDIDQYSRNLTAHEDTFVNLWQEKVDAFLRVPRWVTITLQKLGQELAQYVFRSPTFVAAAISMNAVDFMALMNILLQQKASFMVFSRVRLPRILPEAGKREDEADAKATRRARRKAKEEFPSFLWGIKQHPENHQYYVIPSTGSTVTATLDLTLEQNAYIHTEFRLVQRPYDWPEYLEWPSHPGSRLPGTRCAVCHRRIKCSCQPPDPTSGAFLVELYDYGDMGIGVRALQSIKNGDIIAEYVGEFTYANADINTKYAMHFYNYPPGEEGDPIAMLDAGNHGNWTRYINHACEGANVRFVNTVIGDQQRIIVQADRDIMLYEQLTVDYGSDYWTNGRVCLCGSDYCYTREAGRGALTQAAPLVDAAPVKRSHLMLDYYHSDTSANDETSSTDSSDLPAFGLRPKRTKRRTAKEKEIMEDRKWKHALKHAHDRRTKARAEKRRKSKWEKRWVGKDDPENPRNGGGEGGVAFFREF